MSVSKIMGISTGSLSKFMGIAKASIQKIGGIFYPSNIAYATWNPSDKGSEITLSDKNNVATKSGSGSSFANSGIRSTIGKSSGKWYWEYVYTEDGGSNWPVVGVGNLSANMSDHVGSDTNGWGVYAPDGYKYYNDIGSSYGTSFTQGDVIGVALNMDTGKVWFSKNGTWVSNVISLLHLEGADGSTTFTDVKGKTWNYAGTAQIDTAQYPFGTSSLLLDGDSDYIYTTSSLSDFNFGSGNFTISFKTKLNQSKEQVFVAFKPTSGNCLGIGTDGSNHLYGYIYSGATGYYLMSTLDLTADGNWHDVEFCRDGNTLRMFLDGNAASETTSVTGVTMNNPNERIVIGAAQSPSYYVNGWMKEVRFSKVCRHTSGFTPITSAYGTEPTDGIDEAFSGLTGTIYAFIVMHQPGSIWTAKFGATALSYVAPSGYKSGLYSS